MSEQADGTIILSPRELLHPDEISKRTMGMIDTAMKNFKSGKVSKPVDLNELLEN